MTLILLAGFLELAKKVSEPFYYVAGSAAFLGGLYTYRSNAKRQGAKWAVHLFEKFYESRKYKVMREALDGGLSTVEVQGMVDEEHPDFTDYLNFFEMVTFLAESRQISKKDVDALFDYHLNRLEHYTSVMAYLQYPDKSFGCLQKFLRERHERRKKK